MLRQVLLLAFPPPLATTSTVTTFAATFAVTPTLHSQHSQQCGQVIEEKLVAAAATPLAGCGR
jgi:hypothetical protein